MIEQSDRYPGVDIDAPFESLPTDILADLIRRALAAVQDIREGFDAAHAAMVLAHDALEKGDLERAKLLLLPARQTPGQSEAPIVLN